ncbi:hypothetical protein [Caballeronia sp. SBC2]|uniref:hypothetical protein n=1 Tax=Caballeronia sp. SBC2 TaxID=2705547 RepID=UPI001F1571D8|nr:hypothetical protein [Caballeronia sp. SBC2]
MIFQVHAFLRIDRLDVRIFVFAPPVAQTRLSMLSEQRHEIVVLLDLPVEHRIQERLLQITARTFKKITLVSTDHLGRVREFDTTIIFRAGQPIFCVDVLLKRVNKIDVRLNEAQRFKMTARNEIGFRYDHMNMRFALDKLPRRVIEIAFDLRQMGFSVEIDFVRAIGGRNERTKFLSDCEKCFATHFVFLEAQGDRQIPVNI